MNYSIDEMLFILDYCKKQGSRFFVDPIQVKREAELLLEEQKP